jgi:ferredoxin-NADP reductase
MASPRTEITLKKRQELAPGILELTYVRSDGNPIAYVPGQFFSLHFESGGEEKSRSYSASGQVSDMKENHEFCFVISAVPSGAASQYFFAAEPGDRIQMSGPFGALTLPMIEPKRFILVATGTGIGPYRTMLPSLVQRMAQNPELQVHVIFGVRSRESAIYKSAFEAVAQLSPNFEISVCYSQHYPESAASNEFAGHVQGRFGSFNADPESDIVYLCGNPAMVEDAAPYFKELGFSPRKLKQEKYNFSTF